MNNNKYNINFTKKLKSKETPFITNQRTTLRVDKCNWHVARKM